MTPETIGLIGQREFELMKPEAIIMNVGRGPVIDEAALIDALRTKRISRLPALDVFDTGASALRTARSGRWIMYCSPRIAPTM